MAQFTGKSGRVKPDKPYPDFPLFPHNNGLWAKKICGKLHYFGPWRDPGAAVAKWLDQRDALLAGRTPRTAREGLTVRSLCNRFLTAKRLLLDNGELAQRTWDDYFTVCERIVRVFGKDRLVDDLAASDFAELRADFAQTRGPVALAGDVTRVRSVFKFAYDESLIDQAVRYGQSFAMPKRRVLRKARNGNGGRMFEPAELQTLLAAAGPQMRAMLLVALNTGLGNSDLGRLPETAVDLKSKWIRFPRPKTGIDRRCPLWDETVEALKAVFAIRPKPKDKAAKGLVFLTAKGASWTKDRADNPISKEFSKLQKKVGTYHKGRGFYALRHTFQTVADEAKDPTATSHIMGHSPDSRDMGAVYRERISDDRLVAVTDYVHNWLFGTRLPTGEDRKGA